MELWAFGREEAVGGMKCSWEMAVVVAGRGGRDGAFRHRDVDAKADEGLEKSNISAVADLTVDFFPFQNFVCGRWKLVSVKRVEKCQTVRLRAECI